jgi:hypothetical protein
MVSAQVFSLDLDIAHRRTDVGMPEHPLPTIILREFPSRQNRKQGNRNESDLSPHLPHLLQFTPKAV